MAKPPKPSDKPAVTNETRAISALAVDPRNARRHSEAQVSQIVQSIERFGFVNPIVIQPSGAIVGGHATVQALKRMGRTEVECRVVAGLTDAAYKALGLA